MPNSFGWKAGAALGIFLRIRRRRVETADLVKNLQQHAEKVVAFVLVVLLSSPTVAEKSVGTFPGLGSEINNAWPDRRLGVRVFKRWVELTKKAGHALLQC